MSSKAITEKPQHSSAEGEWQPLREAAPSVVQADLPLVPRTIGIVCLVLLFAPAVISVVLDKSGAGTRIPSPLAILMGMFGLAGLLYHAARETDGQLRQIYSWVGGLGLLVAGVLAFFPTQSNIGGATFLPWGWGLVCLMIALLFLLASGQTELKPAKASGPAAFGSALGPLQDAIESRFGVTPKLFVIGLAGIIMGLVALVGGLVNSAFFLPLGLALGLVGLVYLLSFLMTVGADSEPGYRMGIGVAAVGTLGAIAALGWSLTTKFGWFNVARDQSYLASTGFLLIGLGTLYAATAYGICSDRQLLVLTRRELGALFYSPLIYILLIVFSMIAWAGYWVFINDALRYASQRQPLVEPIIREYIWGFIPIVFIVLVVPLITMRLFSEEWRSQTLEVLLTAPVEDVWVVFSKFIAVLIVYGLTWLPFGLFLLALRIEGGEPFDYRPLISFSLALLFSGAGLLSMGLFCSCLFKNQVAAGVMSAVVMLFLVVVFILRRQIVAGGGWIDNTLTYFSFLDLWNTSLSGRLALSDVVFHISAAVFWLFATVKVLESRKWT